MQKISFRELAQKMNGQWVFPKSFVDEDQHFVHQFCFDSRALQRGECFLALQGNRDGHAFLEEVAHKGAQAAVVKNANLSVFLPQLCVDEPLQALQTLAQSHREQWPGHLIAVTGSVGKTSVRNLLYQLLGKHKVWVTKKNYNNTLGVPLTLLDLSNEHRYAVIELGISEKGEMDILGKMAQPNTTVVTNIALVHTEHLGELNSIAYEKSRLLEYGDSELFLFMDTARYAAFQRYFYRFHVLVEDGNSRFFPKMAFYKLKLGEEKSLDLKIAENSEKHHFDLPPFWTEGMCKNAALALYLADALGIRSDLLQERIHQWQAEEMHGNIFYRNGNAYCLDCYNSSPIALKDRLKFWTQFESQKPHLYVLGAMAELGTHSQALHNQLGKSIHLRSQDRLWVIGEDAKGIADGFLENGGLASQVVFYPNLETAKGDLDQVEGAILIKGCRKDCLERLLEESF